jgi:hypothetical protein
MKTVLICHHDEPLDREALARWLGSFSELVGLIVVEESAERKWRRLRREVRRIGPLRFLDVLAFRAFYKFALARIDARRMQALLQELVDRYPPLTAGTAILHTATPNAPEAERFLQQCAPDLVIARCKFILRESVFRIPALGTFVLHPGICPEYRNAHGCFWALALRDLERVGVTLLKIDRGVDTGPVYGYFTYAYDERTESHIAIQHRSLLENLDAVAHRLREIGEGRATPLDTSGRHSQEWGQPWLTSYFRWKRSAARRPA